MVDKTFYHFQYLIIKIKIYWLQYESQLNTLQTKYEKLEELLGNTSKELGEKKEKLDTVQAALIYAKEMIKESMKHYEKVRSFKN